MYVVMYVSVIQSSLVEQTRVGCSQAVPAAMWAHHHMPLLRHTHPCRLEELHVTNNSISSLPPQLGLMAPTLRVLALEGNVLRAIRRPLLERGTDALLAYLRDRIPA